MRRKARRADKDHESGNRGDEKGSECVNEQRGDHEWSPPQNLGYSKQRRDNLKSHTIIEFKKSLAHSNFFLSYGFKCIVFIN